MARRLLLVTFALLMCLRPAAAEPSHEAMNRAVLEGILLPLHERYAAAMAALPSPVEGLCQAPDAAGLERAQAAFVAALDAWQRLQPVAFGPVVAAGALSRIEFWPDKHGTAGRQLRRALADADPALLKEGVAGQSVALQSLTALEQLLFARDGQPPAGAADAKGRFACQLALAIARFQAELAARIVAGLQGPDGFAQAFAEAAAGNDQFFDAAEASGALLKSIAGSLNAIVVQKLEGPLGEGRDEAKPSLAESWRSGRSLANIQANLGTIEAVYETPGGLGSWLPAAGQVAAHEQLRAALHEATRRLAEVPAPLDVAVADAGLRPEIEAATEAVKTVRQLMANQVAAAAGLSIGFNATDGD